MLFQYRNTPLASLRPPDENADPHIVAGEVLPVNERQILFANGSLLIRRVVRNDAGDYSCRAENDEGMSAVGTLPLSVAGE